MWMSGGFLMSEGGEARNHEADIHAVALRAFHRALDLDDAHMDDAVRAAVVAALDAVRRSPQDEDHEAGIDIAEDAYQRLVAAGFTPKTADGMLRAYLSRCPSPERDTEKLLAFGREHSIAALLDHLGLDELGNEVSRLVEALFEAKGAIPSDRGELHRRLGRILSEFSDVSKDSRVSPDHDPGRTD